MRETRSAEPLRVALRPRDAAAALGISDRYLQTLTANNLIPHVRSGRVVMYPVDQLRQWLADNTTGGSVLEDA